MPLTEQSEQKVEIYRHIKHSETYNFSLMWLTANDKNRIFVINKKYIFFRLLLRDSFPSMAWQRFF